MAFAHGEAALSRTPNMADSTAGCFPSGSAPSTHIGQGEFLVAAQQFGVPHPSGYPLWTFLAWLFSRLPLGNDAWEINLLSGIIGTLVVCLAAAFSRSMLRWFFPRLQSHYPGLASSCAVAAALLFAFSFSMWSQAVIAEVYTLHALLVGLFLVALYAWVRRPHNDALLTTTFFLFVIGFSNHQLVLCLSPLPLLAVFLMRREIFLDIMAAGLFTFAVFYLLLGVASDDPLVWKAALRFAYCIGLVLVICLAFQKLRRLRYFLLIPLASR